MWRLLDHPLIYAGKREIRGELERLSVCMGARKRGFKDSRGVRRIFTADIVLESMVDNKMTLQVVRFRTFTAA